MALVRVTSNPVAISQSTLLVGALFATFILWLAVNNKLVTYWGFLTGGGGTAAAGAAPAVPNPPGSPNSPAPSTAVPFSTDWWNNFLRPWRGG